MLTLSEKFPMKVRIRGRVRVRVKMRKQVLERMSSNTRASQSKPAMAFQNMANRTNPERRRLVSDPMHLSFAAVVNQTMEDVDESFPTEDPHAQAACRQGKQEIIQQITKTVMENRGTSQSSAKNQEIPKKKCSQRKRKLPGSSLYKRREEQERDCDQNGGDADDSETAPEDDNDADKPEQEEEDVSDASSYKWWSFTTRPRTSRGIRHVQYWSYKKKRSRMTLARRNTQRPQAPSSRC